MKRFVVALALALVAACSPPSSDAPQPVEGGPQAVAAPPEVLAAIRRQDAAFVPSASVQDSSTGAVTYKVTGTGAGAPTYSVMNFNEGWSVVQIRRELVWGEAPQAVRDVVATSPQAIVPARVTEVRDMGDEGVLTYELYADASAATPTLIVRKAGDEAAIMPPVH